MRFRGDLDGNELFRNQILNGDTARGRVNGRNGSGNVSKRAGHDFVGGQLVAIGAARAASTKLVAGRDLL